MSETNAEVSKIDWGQPTEATDAGVDGKRRRRPTYGEEILGAPPPTEEELKGPPRKPRTPGGRPAQNRYLNMQVGARLSCHDTTLNAEKKKLADSQKINPNLRVALWASSDSDGVVWSYRFPDAAPNEGISAAAD